MKTQWLLERRSQITIKKLSGYGLLAAFFAFEGTATVNAQTESRVTALEEVIVQARRREESLQQTPIAVSVLSREEMSLRSMTELDSLDNHTPNISITSAPLSSGATFIASAFIRGIGQGDFLATTDPGVGIYVDDVYLARAQGALLDLSDIAQVEVLRGPQGTLFGKNTIGGVIHAISVAPNEEFEGYGEFNYGRFDRHHFRGDVNIPLSDSLFSRFAVTVKRSDGFGDRRDLLTGKKVDEQGNEDRMAGRARFRWLASDNFEANLGFDYTRIRENAGVNDIVGLDPGNALLGFWNAFVADPVPYTEAILTADPYTNFSGSQTRANNRADLDNWGVNLTLNWDLDHYSIKSITSFRDMDVVFGRDGDGGPQEILDNLGELDQDQFSQEFQVSGSAFGDNLDWLVGAYYLKEDAEDLTDVVVLSGIFPALEALPGAIVPLDPSVSCPAPPPAPCAGGAGNPINIGFDNDFSGINALETESYAIFAHGTYHFTDQWSVTAGIRWTHEEKEQLIPFYIRRQSQTDAVPRGTRFAEDYNAVTPKIGVEYAPTDNLMIYVSAARGFKSGGFNGRPTLGFNLGPFDQEYSWSYELGLKSQWFDDQLRLNAAAFFMDYTDIQTTVLVASGATVAPRTDNAGDAELKGLELEITAILTDGFQIDASVGLMDAKYTSLGPATEISIDNEFPQTPDWTLHIGGEYQFSLGDTGRITTRLDYSYRDDHFTDPQNFVNLFQEGYGLLSGKVVFEPNREQWQFGIYGTNLTDEVYLLSGTGVVGALGMDEAMRGRPREYGAFVNVNF